MLSISDVECWRCHSCTQYTQGREEIVNELSGQRSYGNIVMATAGLSIYIHTSGKLISHGETGPIILLSIYIHTSGKLISHGETGPIILFSI